MVDHALFEGDLVIGHDRLMLVLGIDEPAGTALCVWYDGDERRTGEVELAGLEIVSHSALRPGYRLVRR